MKSRTVLLGRFLSRGKEIWRVIREDQVTVYAAQASFFVITSAVPFLSLLFALTGAFLPGSQWSEKLAQRLPTVMEELRNPPHVSLLSLSAVTTLWTASRGIAAIRGGIERVYHAGMPDGFFRRRIRSILSTVFFILMLVATVALLLFGDFLSQSVGPWLSEGILTLRMPLSVALMTVIFTAVYVSVSKRSDLVSHRIAAHWPGGILAALGWVLFSRIYSVYIEHFPRATSVYGSLTAICLIMLWLYSCMILMLLGAVVNKLWFASLKKQANRRRI